MRPERVHVDDVAAAAGVSPRTYDDCSAGRQQAVAAAVTAEREPRDAQPADAVVPQYADQGSTTAARCC